MAYNNVNLLFYSLRGHEYEMNLQDHIPFL